MDKVQYLAYIIDEKGVHVNPSKIQVILDWLAMKTLENICSFLSLASFYQISLLGFSFFTCPLS